MKKFRLLLLDANVVIEISRQGLWDQMTARCDIHLAQTVLDESQFYDDDQGDRHYIDLTSYITVLGHRVFITNETDGHTPHKGDGQNEKKRIM